MSESKDKAIVIYYQDSYYRYEELYRLCVYEVTENGDLVVYERDRVSGHESAVARFRKWDYFLIEES